MSDHTREQIRIGKNASEILDRLFKTYAEQKELLSQIEGTIPFLAGASSTGEVLRTSLRGKYYAEKLAAITEAFNTQAAMAHREDVLRTLTDGRIPSLAAQPDATRDDADDLSDLFETIKGAMAGADVGDRIVLMVIKEGEDT